MTTELQAKEGPASAWRSVELHPAPCGTCRRLAYPNGEHVGGGRCRTPGASLGDGLVVRLTVPCVRCKGTARQGDRGTYCPACGHGTRDLRPSCPLHGAMLQLPTADVFACNHCSYTADYIDGSLVIFQEA